MASLDANGSILEYRSTLLLDRVKLLFKLMEGDVGHTKFVADQSGVHATSIQRYLRGETTMRLHNLGKVLAAVRQYFHEHPELRSVVSFDLLEVQEIARGLSLQEYKDMAVTGSQELEDKLLRDVLDRMPRIDLRPLADEIIDQYEASALHRRNLYIPLSARTHSHKKDEVSSGKGCEVHRQLGHVDGHLLAFANDLTKSPVLFLLGDLGTGKTTTVRHLEYRLAQKYKERPIDERLPVYVNLRLFNKAVSIERFLVSIFNGDLQLDLERGWEDIRRLIEAGKLIFLLDGFDEMSERITTIEIERNLEEIAKLSHIKNNKVLLSTRTHLHKSDEEILAAYNKTKPDGLPLDSSEGLIFLNRFTRDDWNTYLDRVFGAKADEYRKKIETLDSYESLMAHPLLLRMTTEVLPTLVVQDRLKRTDIFHQYVMRWIEREEWRSSLQPEQRLQLADELAWSLFKNNLTHINFQHLQHLTEKFFPQIKQGRDIDVLHHEVRTASFLNRNESGDYSFVNPVFMYYFQARAIQKHIVDNDPRDVGREKIHPEVLELLAEMQPDANTLLEWSSHQTDHVKSVVGPYLEHNAKAILALINPIKTELLGKLDYVVRKKDFVSDPILAHIANTSLPRLKEPIRTIDVFGSYVDPWFAEQAAELKGPESHVHFLIEEFAWVLNSHPHRRVTPEVFRHNLSDAEHPNPTGGRIRELFASCPFLQRDGDTFSFQHEYLREYFLAKAIFYRINSDRPVRTGYDLWSARVLELLAELKPEPDNLIKWIQFTRKPTWSRQETGVYLASNAMSLLHLQKKPFANLALDDAMLPEVALPGVSLEGKSLVRVGFSKADLQGAILKEANLSGANLDGADLRGAVLTRANLTGADLSNANLEGAYLTHADLTDANLHGANLTHATLTGVIGQPPKVAN